MANITKIRQKTSDGYEEYDFLGGDEWWVDYVTIPADTTITNGTVIDWTKGLNYDPTPDSPRKQNLYVFWDGCLLKPKKNVNSDGLPDTTVDGHYTEASSNLQACVFIYRSDDDGDYILTKDVLVTIIGKYPNY